MQDKKLIGVVLVAIGLATVLFYFVYELTKPQPLLTPVPYEVPVRIEKDN